MNIPPNSPELPMATSNIKNPEIKNNGVKHTVFASSARRGKKDSGKREKLTKVDIGSPTNFRHVAHVERRENIGFELNNLAAELICLFEMCGISMPQLEGKENGEVISGITETKESKGDVKCKLMRQSHLPPTAQNQCAPTTPPAHASIPDVSTCPPPAHTHAPPRSMVNSRGDSNLPSPRTRSTLLSQIREGTRLKKVEQKDTTGIPPPPLPPGPPTSAPQVNSKVIHKAVSSLPSSGNRSALLTQIREDIKLKEVKQRNATGVRPPPPTPGPPPPASPPFTITSRSDGTQLLPKNRSALLTQIREGIQLKEVKRRDTTGVPPPPPPPPLGPPHPASATFAVTCRSDSPHPSPGNRSALLTQIREGIQLKKVKQNDSTSVPARRRDNIQPLLRKRSALQSQFRKGTQVKEVEQRDSARVPPPPSFLTVTSHTWL